ncbi:NADP-dependent oxidoreductase domain-containing protein [Mucor lusitanicus]
MSSGAKITLNDGNIMPAFGLGTWQSKPKEVYTAVLTALQAGYRHIDTAFVYRNEKEVGQAIKDSGIPRQELFITTKLWNNSHRPDLVEKALEVSLANLQLEYLDLYLMHWPVAFQPSKSNFPKTEDGKIALDSTSFVDTYAAMEKLVASGKTKSIGVSNFNIYNLDKLLKHCKIPPAVNQVEMHPYLSQPDLAAFCQKNNVHVTAYSPLGSTDSPVMQEPLVVKGCSVIPKSVTPSRIISNFQVIQLDQKEFASLEELTKNKQGKRLLDPSPFWGVDIYKSKL